MTNTRHRQDATENGGNRLRELLTKPVSPTSLAAFRIGFGLVMVVHALWVLAPYEGKTRLAREHLEVTWHFTYPGFSWVRDWPEPFLSLHFGLVAVAGLFVALGFCYRTSAVILFLSYTYTFLLDVAYYNNHYYFMSLLAFLLIWMPGQACWSIDAWIESRRARLAHPDAAQDRVTSIPFWPVFLLRAQLFLAYFYGGVAKLNTDWLTGVPLLSVGIDARAFLGRWIDLPTLMSVKNICLFLAWGGLVFDLGIGFLLCMRRTRVFGLVLTLFFHCTNRYLFDIGVFPYLAMVSTLIFLEPDWPLRIKNWGLRPRLLRPDWGWLLAGACAVPLLGGALGWKIRPSTTALPPCTVRRPRLATSLVLSWVVVQSLLPLRHYLIAGDANWTDEGHRFAWRMMLRFKRAEDLHFEIEDPALSIAMARGNPQINWKMWPADLPRVVFLNVDASRMDWSKLPEIVVVYEDLVGGRIVYNPAAAGAPQVRSREAYQQRIAELWRMHFDRLPKVLPTVSPTDAFKELHERLTHSGRQFSADQSAQQAVVRQIDEALTLVAQLDENDRATAARDQLETVLEPLIHGLHAEYVRDCLSRIRPFGLDGVTYDVPFLIIDDPQLTIDNGWEALRSFNRGQNFPVYMDPSRLYIEGWKRLPRVFFCYMWGKPRVFWNFYHELIPMQIVQLGTSPFLLHQYAVHVARQWKIETGRRPEVHVRAPVVLNYRLPMQLVDPNADLSRVTYSISAHNPWISQLRQSVPVEVFDEVSDVSAPDK